MTPQYVHHSISRGVGRPVSCHLSTSTQCRHSVALVFNLPATKAFTYTSHFLIQATSRGAICDHVDIWTLNYCTSLYLTLAVISAGCQICHGVRSGQKKTIRICPSLRNQTLEVKITLHLLASIFQPLKPSVDSIDAEPCYLFTYFS